MTIPTTDELLARAVEENKAQADEIERLREKVKFEYDLALHRLKCVEQRDAEIQRLKAKHEACHEAYLNWQEEAEMANAEVKRLRSIIDEARAMYLCGCEGCNWSDVQRKLDEADASKP